MTQGTASETEAMEQWAALGIDMGAPEVADNRAAGAHAGRAR